jgi:hypothetical protein
VPGGGPEARRLGWQPNALRRALGSGADREAIAAAMLLGEASDAVIIGNQRAGEADGCGDQQPVRRIALFKVMKLIAARSGKVIKRHRLDARAIDEALDPSLGPGRSRSMRPMSASSAISQAVMALRKRVPPFFQPVD